MTVYAARHGQTEWNLVNRICGISDISLTAKGIEQANLLAEALSNKRIDIILTSPLVRAVKTASVVAERIGGEIVVEPRLTERDYGVFEGANRKEPAFLEAKKHFPGKLSGGESILQVAQRVFNLLDDIKTHRRDLEVLIISHGGICRVIHAYFNDQTNEDFNRTDTRNCEWREYRFIR